MINKVLLFGTVGDHVWENATQGGQRVLSFSIKQESSYKDKNTKEVKKSQAYFNVSMFSEDVMVNSGDNVLLEGKLSNKKNKDGKYELSITAYKLEVIKQHTGNHDAPVIEDFKIQDIPF